MCMDRIESTVISSREHYAVIVFSRYFSGFAYSVQLTHELMVNLVARLVRVSVAKLMGSDLNPLYCLSLGVLVAFGLSVAAVNDP